MRTLLGKFHEKMLEVHRQMAGQGWKAPLDGCHEISVGHIARGLDRRQRRVVSVRWMTEKQQTHNGHEILVRRQTGIGPPLVGDLPEPRLELPDADEMTGSRGTHVIPLHATVLPGMRSRLPSSSATIGSRKALQPSSSCLVSSTERQSTVAVHRCA